MADLDTSAFVSCPSVVISRPHHAALAPLISPRPYHTYESRWARRGTTPTIVPVIECRRGSRNSRNQQQQFDSTAGRRPNRVSELIRREVGPIIDDYLASAFRRARPPSASSSSDGDASPVDAAAAAAADAAITVSPTLLVSVVDVKCSPDLRNARVSVSVLGTDDDRTKVMSWLRMIRKEIRYELAQCVTLKYMPDVSFAESELAAAANTVNILNKLANKRASKSDVNAQAADTDMAAGGPGLDDGLDYDASADDAIIFEDEGSEEEDDDDDGVMIIDVADADKDGDGPEEKG